jgi:hypothetical protein
MQTVSTVGSALAAQGNSVIQPAFKSATNHLRAFWFVG